MSSSAIAVIRYSTFLLDTSPANMVYVFDAGARRSSIKAGSRSRVRGDLLPMGSVVPRDSGDRRHSTAVARGGCALLLCRHHSFRLGCHVWRFIAETERVAQRRPARSGYVRLQLWSTLLGGAACFLGHRGDCLSANPRLDRRL